MKGQQPLLIDFCDSMGIEHNGEGSVEGDLPETLDDEKLKATVDTLRVPCGVDRPPPGWAPASSPASTALWAEATRRFCVPGGTGGGVTKP